MKNIEEVTFEKAPLLFLGGADYNPRQSDCNRGWLTRAGHNPNFVR